MLTRKEIGQRIRKLREDLGVSQEKLALEVGLSRPAVSQIESGIRAIESTELARVAEYFSVSCDSLLAEKTAPKTKISRRFKIPAFDKEKFKQVFLYILEKCGAKPNVGETVLYKLLYFCDFNFYELYEKPLTGLSYRKIDYGPAPTKFKEIIDELEKKGMIKKIIADYYGKPQKKYFPLVNPDLEKFTAAEKEIIDKVIENLSSYDAAAIKEYSHRDIPCEITPDKEIIDYETVFYRQPPYSVRSYSGD